MTIEPAAPRILVLLAAFNGARWIEEQIRSILVQRDVDVHIFVRDDGSADQTRMLLNNFEGNRLTVLAPESPTGSAAQNFFAMIRANDATGYRFVAFSDQDDIWNHDRLHRAVLTLQDGNFVGYSSAVTAFWGSHKTRTLRQSPTITQSDFLFEGAGQGCTFVLSHDFYCRIRRFLIQHQNLTPGLHYHDWTTYALARAWSLEWSFDIDSTLRYRQHRRNDTGAKYSFAGISKRINQIANGWYRHQLISIWSVAVQANASHPVITEWGRLLTQGSGVKRRLRIAQFCASGGRRKLSDRIVVIAAALMGWI